MTQFIDDDEFYDAEPGRKIEFIPIEVDTPEGKKKQATSIKLLKKGV